MFYYTPGERMTFDLGGIWHLEPNSSWVDAASGQVGVPTSGSHGNWRSIRMRPDAQGDVSVGDGPVASVRGAFIGGASFQPGRPDEFRTSFLKSTDPLVALKQSYSCREYGFRDAKKGTQDKPGDDPCAVFWGGPQVGSTMEVRYEHAKVNGVVFNNRTSLVVTFNDNATLADVPIPNAYRTICLGRPVASTSVSVTDLFRCWTFILNLRPRVAACNVLPVEDGDCGKKTAFPAGIGSVIPVAAGQTMKAYVYFEDYNRDLTGNCSRCDNVEISVKSNPGLPNGATLFATKGMLDLNNDAGAPSRKVDVLVGGAMGKAQYFVASRELHFTPSMLDARLVDTDFPSNGIKYQVCFEAKSRRNGGTGDFQYSDVACMFFQVVRPQPVLVAATQARPTPGVVLNFDAELPLSVRCPYAWDLNIKDAKDGLDAGALRLSTAFDAGYEAGKYHIIATEDPAHPLPAGATITQGGGVQQLRWTPTRGMEGHEFELCVRLQDAVLEEGAVLKCTTAFVRKCEVCSLGDDTLNSIAMEYHTDWLQLWGANYDVQNPNHVEEYKRLKLGPMYTTSKDESVTVLASNFGMTEEGLRRVNPDLAGMDRYATGTPVCLIPQICGGAGETAM